MSPPPAILDALGRPLRDLRISVTDRCNLRCPYCMPAEVFGPGHAFLPQSEVLSFEETARAARLLVGLGVEKLRLTGGEPLLRRDLSTLVAMLRPLGAEIALTTNGLLLPRHAAELKAAGLARVTVSLDSLDPDTCGRMNGLGVHPDRVLDGIEAALAAGLPVKVNTVVRRGVNDAGLRGLWLGLRERAVVRFIEYMDVGNVNGWNLREVLPSGEVLQRLAGEDGELDFTPLPSRHPGEVAGRHVSSDGFEVGTISSVSAPFCGSCNRLRLSAAGELYTCLFGSEGFDLKARLRGGADDDALRGWLASLWAGRRDRYSEERGEEARTRGEETGRRHKVEMSRVGG